MALLAVPPQTRVQAYKELYSEKRWDDLLEFFRKEYLDMHAVPQKPLLLSNLQAGLSAIKTRQCGNQHNLNINCPVCSPPYSDLSKDLPFSHHENSSLVCRISGSVMNENNPPMILPNGRVYCRQSLEEMAAKSNGKINCPMTNQTFSITEVRKVFIL